MPSLRLLRINMADLIEAMTPSPDDLEECFLDIETGGVERLSRDDVYDDIPEMRELRETIEAHPDRYEEIPKREGRDDYALMAHFAEGVEEDDIRDLLTTALQGKGAFSRFRDAVCRYPDLRDAWDALQQKEMETAATEWLAGLGIKPECEPGPSRAPEPPRPAAAPKILLEHVLAYGAPDGKTELIEGKVLRQVCVRSAEEARSIFKTLCRQLCEYKGVAWRNRFIEGTSTFFQEGMHIRHSGTRVEVEVEIPPEVVRRMSGTT